MPMSGLARRGPGGRPAVTDAELASTAAAQVLRQAARGGLTYPGLQPDARVPQAALPWQRHGWCVRCHGTPEFMGQRLIPCSRILTLIVRNIIIVVQAAVVVINRSSGSRHSSDCFGR